MSNDADFELIRRFGAAGHGVDVAVLDEILAPDFVAHGGAGDVHGAEGWRAYLVAAETQFGPTEAETVEMVGDGELIAQRWTISGASGISAHGMTMHRIAGGKIAENWAVLHMDN